MISNLTLDEVVADLVFKALSDNSRNGDTIDSNLEAYIDGTTYNERGELLVSVGIYHPDEEDPRQRINYELSLRRIQ